MLSIFINDLLVIHVVVPLLGALIVLGRPYSLKSYGMMIAIWVSGFELMLSLVLLLLFDVNSSGYQFVSTIIWIPSMNIGITFGVDGISRFFVVLTSIRTPRCLLASVVNVNKIMHIYYGMFLLLEACVQGVFLVTDIIAFYVCFEVVLIPIFVIIGVWGSRERKVRAAYFFFRYTLVGSLMMLMGIIYIYNVSYTTDITLLSQLVLTDTEERLRWLSFFLALATKVPMMPVHIWLPEAHVEAPTGGSVILAGIRLKRGTYGMVRRRLVLIPSASVFYTPLVYMLSIIAILYASITAIRQTDIKRIVAYASVAHINITLVGVFSMNVIGRQGAIIQMRSHGLVAGAMFICIGVRYDRHHTRRVSYYSGLATTMPLYASVFRFFTLANIAFPGTSAFVGEFIIRLGVLHSNVYVTIMSTVGMVLGGAYSRWLYNRLAYGNVKHMYLDMSVDITRREVGMFIPLVVLTLLLGVYPSIVIDYMSASCVYIVEHVMYS
jgi:NADH-quinone oxidoreductase subunit M